MSICPSCQFENDPAVYQCAACGKPIDPFAEFEQEAADLRASTESTPDPRAAHTPGEERILGLLRAGQKIQAIKVHREMTGLGLKESKEAVEALAKRHGIAEQSSPPGMGCIIVAVLVAIVMLATLLG